jgi:hypothetical protein
MNKESFEKLIQDKPPDIQAKGVVLYNSVTITAKAYQNEPLAGKLKDWQASEAALNDFIRSIDQQKEEDPRLETIADVLAYLKAGGWKVTKTSLYRHQKEGKFVPRDDGTYRLNDIDRYARAWLREQSTGKRRAERIDELQRKKLEQELQNLEIENKRKIFNFEKDQGKYVPKEMMEIELATRAGILDAGLKHWIQSHTAEWIRAVNGDMKKIGELINIFNRTLDEHINTYASAREYQVIINAEEETETEIEN